MNLMKVMMKLCFSYVENQIILLKLKRMNLKKAMLISDTFLQNGYCMMVLPALRRGGGGVEVEAEAGIEEELHIEMKSNQYFY